MNKNMMDETSQYIVDISSRYQAIKLLSEGTIDNFVFRYWWMSELPLWKWCSLYEPGSLLHMQLCSRLGRTGLSNRCSTFHAWRHHSLCFHDDVIKWRHFPRYWTFVRGIHRSPVNSPHKGQWRGALIFSLICTRWISVWVKKNHEAGDLSRHRAHYDVTVMRCWLKISFTDALYGVFTGTEGNIARRQYKLGYRWRKVGTTSDIGPSLANLHCCLGSYDSFQCQWSNIEEFG